MRPDNHHLRKGRNIGDDKGARKLQSDWKAAIHDDNIHLREWQQIMTQQLSAAKREELES
jgi:hypothetical protein